MLVREVMTPAVRTIEPDHTVRDAARLMDELNVGILPVCLDQRLVGVVTDRDIVVRSTAAGTAPGDQRVQELLTTDVTTCHADEDARTVLGRMSRLQVRRMPVVDQNQHLVGLVSLGDLAAGQAPGTDETLRNISSPAEPDRSGTPSTARADASRDARPSPLSDEERQELERRLAEPPGTRPDAGRAPDPDSTAVGSSGGPRDEDNVRAAFGIAGSPAGGGSGRMPGGLGGDGYNMYGEMFGPGEDGARPVTLSDDVDHIPAPDAELEGPVGNEGGGPSTSSKPQAEDAHVGRVVFSSGSNDDAGQPRKAREGT
jgi:CBS domain-containing protein